MKKILTKSMPMKKMHLLAAAISVVLVSGLAVAQTVAPKAPHRIDANGDGVITKAEAAQFPRLAGKFDQLDKDKNGSLSAAELPRHKGGKHRGGRGHMKAMDTDNDGRISKAESQAAASRFASRFDAMDANKDGYVDRADRQLKAEQMRTAFFNDADSNRDGRLSRDEFVVERGARNDERREKFRQRAEAAGKTRKAPTDAERIQSAGAAFDRIDTNKDGQVSKAEFEAFKPMRGGDKRPGAPASNR